MKYLFLAISVLFPFNVFSYPVTPTVGGDYCTDHDPDFDGYRYAEQIPHCKRKVSTKIKDKVCERDGVYGRKDFTVDHLIPLSLGGSNSRENLWCQHKSLNHTSLEYRMFLDVRDGHRTRDDAVGILFEHKFGPSSFTIDLAAVNDLN